MFRGAPDTAVGTAWQRKLSRVCDVTFASVALLLLGLPMLLVGLIIRMTSRGPVLYRQMRIGLNGRPFVILKFRTMRVDAEERTGPIWARPGDPRCTFFGKMLRRLSIDELPQLINVIRGEMSLVGPRPERPFFVRNFSRELPHYPERHRVLPGITGWAQVNGWRGDTPIDKRLAADLDYIRNWSLTFNLRILAITPFRVLFGKNAC